MAEKTKKSKEDKMVILEREYVIPLRRAWLKAAKYKRAEKAITAIREFILKHMKMYGQDIRQVKIDRYVNEEIWFRGIKKPLDKIKIKAIKYLDNSVSVVLAEIPEYIKFKVAREEKLKTEGKKKAEEKEKDRRAAEEKIKAEQEKEAEKSKEEVKEEKKEEKELEKITGEKQEKEKDEMLKHETKSMPKEKQNKQPKAKQEVHKFATGR